MIDCKSKIDAITLMLEVANEQSPNDIVIVCRQVLEKCIDMIFDIKNVNKPISASLLELINHPVVKEYFDNDVLLDTLHFVRIVGANAHHDKHIKKTQAKVAYDNTVQLLSFIKEKQSICSSVAAVADNQNNTVTSIKMNEIETRRVYIDLYLDEAGWDVLPPNTTYQLSNGRKVKTGTPIPGKACSEVLVEGLENQSGVGFCDYVLFGKDGKPLAIVEAKKTSVDPIKGQQQVREYGKCMEQKYGYIPVLYYTNGYEIYVIDGKYPPRKVSAFHTLEEISYLIQRRNHTRIVDMKVNAKIAGRPYQMMAITNICERFNQNFRRGLLVMATGTGKTRTAIALVDILTRNNYVKNVLFLADRTSLVRQALKNFRNLLPDFTYCALSDKSLANEPNARITFSTHQTMINFIDNERRDFSIGRFDLIIIDEAHRSIFNKYGAIFSYFDSLLVGLTATPKDEVDANTYDLFNCESGVPNFAYSLKEAISENYLVPYKLVNRTTTQLENGILYDELSDKDKEEVNRLTNVHYNDGDIITQNKLFTKIFNKDTCKRVLDDLMKMGQRVDGGQQLGKSIIFAVNHYHADLIVKTFNELYPKFPEYCKLIDNQVKNSEHLIDEFEKDPKFRIAVSVDMLDTGIDVPAVLNLVFFKRVNSNIKLIQMIGRGTRLCPKLIDGQDKKFFLIFDYFNNLKDENPESVKPPVTIYQKIFEIKLKMMCEMQNAEHQMMLEHKAYYTKLRSELIQIIQSIKKDGSKRLSVRANMKFVDKYCDENKWQYISPNEEKEINYSLRPLVESNIKEEYLSLSFDYKMLKIEERLIFDGNILNAVNIVKNIRLIAQQLRGKASINDILLKIDDINELYMGNMWNHPSISKLEYYRESIRHLMKYLIEEKRIVSVMIDKKDDTKDGEEIDTPFIDIRTYKEKVTDYIMENLNNPTIQKIRNLEPLTVDDFEALEDILWVKLGSKEEYYSITSIDNLAVFMRSIVGLEQDVINEKFGQYLNENVLTAEQMEFINTIINYVKVNGDITGREVISESPFDTYSVLDLFDDQAYIVADVVNTLHNCIEKL